MTATMRPRVRRSRRRWVTLRRLVTMASLVFAWCALWGEVSVANLASGVLLAAAVSFPSIATPGVGRVRLWPLLQFGALVAKDLVVSTAQLAWDIVTPTDHSDEAIIAVAVPSEARAHLLLLVTAITVTPGTAVVDADPDTGTLYLHLLYSSQSDEVTAHVNQLAELASRALPVTAREVAS